jgi:CBS-domain-containing membrane protein
MQSNHEQKTYLVNANGNLVGQVLQDELRLALHNQTVQSGQWQPTTASCVKASMPMHDLAKEVVKAKHSVAVVDVNQKLLGQVSQAGLLSRLVAEEI